MLAVPMLPIPKLDSIKRLLQSHVPENLRSITLSSGITSFSSEIRKTSVTYQWNLQFERVGLVSDDRRCDRRPCSKLSLRRRSLMSPVGLEDSVLLTRCHQRGRYSVAHTPIYTNLIPNNWSLYILILELVELTT
jgi:hypothetical protein